METWEGNPCANFSRTKDYYAWRVDGGGDTSNITYLRDTIPNVTLCGAGDIAAADSPQVKVFRWTDSLYTYVDSQIVILTRQ